MASGPEPVLSARILKCSGSTCRPATETDQHCDREEDRRGLFNLLYLQNLRDTFTCQRTQTSRAAASASGSPTCSCLPSAAGTNGKDTSLHATFVQEQLIQFPPSAGQQLTCTNSRDVQKYHKLKKKKSLSGFQTFPFKGKTNQCRFVDEADKW